MFSLVKSIVFLSGLAVGTVGSKILTSDDAKKVYTHATAAVLRVKDSVIDTVTKIHENAIEIISDAKEINETIYNCECEDCMNNMDMEDECNCNETDECNECEESEESMNCECNCNCDCNENENENEGE